MTNDSSRPASDKDWPAGSYRTVRLTRDEYRDKSDAAAEVARRFPGSLARFIPHAKFWVFQVKESTP